MITDVGMHAGPPARRTGPTPVGQLGRVGHVGRLRWDDSDPTPRRLRSSVGTFGPFGRVAATGLVVLFVLWFFQLGPFVFFVVPALPVVGWALRDIWSRAPAEPGPQPTQAPEFGDVSPGRGPRDPVQPSLWSSWEAPPVARAAGTEADDADEADPEPDGAPAPEPGPATEEEQLALAHLLDPRLAASLRDGPRTVPPPFPGEAARQAGGAAGAAGAAGPAGSISGAPA